MSTRLPGAVGEVRSLGPLAYAFVLENWTELSRLAGEGPFSGRHWLLPGAAYWSTEPEVALQMIADQQRLNGDAGASPAQQAAAAIRVRHRVRERDATTLPAVLAGWAPK